MTYGDFFRNAPQNIEEYIAQQPENVQPYLRQIHDAIKNALPDAVQKISWSMPTYWKKQNLIQFAASKKHIGLYPDPAMGVTKSERVAHPCPSPALSPASAQSSSISPLLAGRMR